MKLIPESSAVCRVRIAMDSSTGLKTPPRDDAPKLRAETLRPVLPRVRYSKSCSLCLAEADSSAKDVVKHRHGSQQSCRNQSWRGRSRCGIPENYGDGIGPREVFNLFRWRRRRHQANNHVEDAAQAEHPPCLHQERDPKCMADDFFPAERGKIEYECQCADQKAENECSQGCLFGSPTPEDSKQRYCSDRRSKIRRNDVNRFKNAGIPSALSRP